MTHEIKLEKPHERANAQLKPRFHPRLRTTNETIVMSSTPSHRILIVDNDAETVDLLTLNLRKAGGFTISTAEDGATGLRKARKELPALIILAQTLPKTSGLEVCKMLKNSDATRHIPVIMLTAKGEEIDRIRGMEFGADESVTKPFDPREIILRVKAILCRGAGENADGKMTSGAITVDPEHHHVTVAGKNIRLTSVEFKLLAMLMKRRGQVQARDRLLHEVWGYQSIIDTRTVDAHVRRLRKKLGKAADAIETVRGFGYRLREDPVTR